MKFAIRRSPQTLLVLKALLRNPREWRYGYDLSRHTELKSGTLYPILARLTAQKCLETRWEKCAPGTPPRHLYRFTKPGARYSAELVRSAKP